MRLQRVKNRERGDKTYSKWQITIPPEAIDSLGWEAGDELEAVPERGRLVIKKKG